MLTWLGELSGLFSAIHTFRVYSTTVRVGANTNREPIPAS